MLPSAIITKTHQLPSEGEAPPANSICKAILNDRPFSLLPTLRMGLAFIIQKKNHLLIRSISSIHPNPTSKRIGIGFKFHHSKVTHLQTLLLLRALPETAYLFREDYYHTRASLLVYISEYIGN